MKLIVLKVINSYLKDHWSDFFGFDLINTVILDVFQNF